MRKLFFVAILMICLPVFGITYLHINGSDHAEITPPAEIVITADVAEPGNVLMITIIEDSNMNGVLDSLDEIGDYFGIIDGVPSIGDRDGDYIIGDDDSTANGVVMHVARFDEIGYVGMGPTSFTIFAIAEDEDGSTAQATLVINFDTEPEPSVPYIYGNISEEGTGEPVVGAMLIFHSDDESEHIGVSDSDGNYFVSIPATGSYGLANIVDWSGERSSIMLDEPEFFEITDDSTMLNYELSPLDARIQGRVTYSESGEGVPDALVLTIALDYSVFALTRSDADGNYEIGQNVGSMAIVQAMYDDHETDTMHIITVTEPIMAGYDFQVLQPTSFVSGAVFYPDSTPVPAVTVRASTREHHYHTKTDHYGGYYLRVNPGEYNLRAEFVVQTEPRAYEITVGDDGLEDMDFYLDYGEGLGSISGNVSNSAGEPVEDAFVILSPEEDSNIIQWHKLKTDEHGDFIFSDILPGIWKLGSYKEGLISSDPEIYFLEHELTADLTDNDFVFTIDAIKEAIVLRANQLRLHGASPNPFNPKTRIKFETEQSGEIGFKVYDNMGRVVRQLRKTISNSGIQSIDFDGEDLPSGTYIFSIEGEETSETGKMMLIK